MAVLSRTRRAASIALSGTAEVLASSAKVVKWAADAVRPGQVTAEDVAGVYERRGRVKAPQGARTGTAEELAYARTSPSHVAALAERPAAEVVAEVDRLSTDELRLLLEHEQAHKRRSTVIAAIERAAAQHLA